MSLTVQEIERIAKYEKDIRNAKDFYVNMLDGSLVQFEGEDTTSTESSFDTESRLRLVHYMGLAVICFTWEGLITSLNSKLKWTKPHERYESSKELKELYLLRNCIMHHDGDVRSFNEHNKKYPDSQITTIKYPHYRIDPNGCILLSDIQVKAFFDLLIEKGPDFIVKTIVKRQVG